MANPTYNRVHAGKPRAGMRESYRVANGVTLYAGAIVGIKADGYLDYWNNIATNRCAGILLEQVTGNTSASPPPEGQVAHGDIIVADVTGVSDISSVNALVYSQDGNITSLTLTSATSPAIGYVSRFISTSEQEVTLFTPAELEAKI